MGTWGCGVLESDSAQDFIDQARSLSVEGRLAFVEDILVKVAADASLVNREFLPEEVVVAAAIVAAASVGSHEYAWIDGDNFLDVIRDIRPQAQLHAVALGALRKVAEGDSSILLSGWKSDSDRAAVTRQIGEIKAVLSGT
ncbi:DUF4259 domain-containing protein [Streptomyces sp. NPDC051217]|uniref:DUF4259 domain-containing protein n=1 Tax=Streptomyces sp. NPDC051217 TaxID=3365644 RepID=UPI0037AF7F63